MKKIDGWKDQLFKKPLRNAQIRFFKEFLGYRRVDD